MSTKYKLRITGECKQNMGSRGDSPLVRFKE